MTSLAARLPRRDRPDSLHLQHGPIDLVLSYHGDAAAVDRAYAMAATYFDGLLQALVDELPALRAQTRAGNQFAGAVAQRMQRATESASRGTFVTPMAAVAGSVADAVLEASWVPGITRASVNNGGDIALRLAPQERYTLRVCSLDNQPLADFSVHEQDGIGGVATSGRGGRSLSCGIADSVTVLASCAAEADVAATLIANAVDMPGCDRIVREPANALQPDSDLGERLVVTHCGDLDEHEVAMALDNGACCAREWVDRGAVKAVALFLRGATRVVGCERSVALAGSASQERQCITL